MIEDLSSVNGTAINDKDLAPNTKAELENGDTLRIGTVTFSVHFLPS
jgi:pSer/pThr/pTyr-binding forkhead associated (FHA) protein